VSINGKREDSGNWLWSFVIWLAGDTNVVVPDGTVMTLTAKEPDRTSFTASVTGDGTLTVIQLQQMAISQFETQGVTFTQMISPQTGQTGYMSQSFTGTSSNGVGRVSWNGAWVTYLSGAGVQAVPAQ